jgi:hypothetical protein
MSSPAPTTAERILTLVKQYHRVPVNTPDVDGLLELRKHLAVLCFGFAREVGDLYQERNGAEFRRRAQFTRERQRLIEEGHSAAKAEAEAQAGVEEALKEEMTADGIWKAAGLVYNAAKDVLDTLCQHIAHVRHEKAREIAGQGSQ